jgi:hypothetical protein
LPKNNITLPGSPPNSRIRTRSANQIELPCVAGIGEVTSKAARYKKPGVEAMINGHHHQVASAAQANAICRAEPDPLL